MSVAITSTTCFKKINFLLLVTVLLWCIVGNVHAQAWKKKTSTSTSTTKPATTTPTKTTTPNKTTTTKKTTTTANKTSVTKPDSTTNTVVATDSTATNDIEEVKTEKKQAKEAEVETTNTTDSTKTEVPDNSATDKKPAPDKPAAKPKEIKKLADCNLPPELEFKIKNMGPNELLDLKEDFKRNQKEDDNIEYTITTKLLFAQDAILGYIKRAPVYASNNEEISTTIIRIPVKFCCTDKLDSLHKKQHCGLMSELNELEDIEHCKTWIQKEEKVSSGKVSTDVLKARNKKAKDSLDAIGEGYGKGVKKPTKKEIKKGGKNENVDNATDSTGTKPSEDEDYGKPVKGKKDKKAATKKGSKSTYEDEPTTPSDSSGVKQETPIIEKPTKEDKSKKSKKEEKKKDASKEENTPPDETEKANKKEKKDSKKEEKKVEKQEDKKETDNKEAAEFGKPVKKEKEKKADKKKKKEDKPEETEKTDSIPNN